MLKFEGINAARDVAMFSSEPPTKPEGDDATPEALELHAAALAQWEKLRDARIKVRLVDRADFRRWSYEHERLVAENKVARKALREKFSKEDAPHLYADTYIVHEIGEAINALMFDAVSASVIELRGIEVEDQPIAAYADGPSIARMLEHTNLLGRAFLKAMHAQAPERRDAFC